MVRHYNMHLHKSTSNIYPLFFPPQHQTQKEATLHILIYLQALRIRVLAPRVPRPGHRPVARLDPHL